MIGVLPVFLRILKCGCKEEKATTARIIWTMSFDKKVCEKIAQFKEMTNILVSLERSEDEEIVRNVKGARFVLQGENDVSECTYKTCFRYILKKQIVELIPDKKNEVKVLFNQRNKANLSYFLKKRVLLFSFYAS